MMKKIILLSIFLLNLLTLVSNIDMGNQMLAQNMGSEVTVYPCKTFDPTTGDDVWHFSTSPCNNDLDGTCVSVCRTCGMQGDCESMKYHSHGTGNSGGDNSYRDGNTQPSPGGGSTIGGGGSSGGSTGSSAGHLPNIFDNTVHIPTADELCIKYKEGYLPSSYKEQDCDYNCLTACMEYCYNFYRNCLDDKSGLNREQFEWIFYDKSNGVPICNIGFFNLSQHEFLMDCGFDVKRVDISKINDYSEFCNALSQNHPIMATLDVKYNASTKMMECHEVVVVSYHALSNTYEAIDPAYGNIHVVDVGKIRDAYIINGYSLIKP